MAIVVQNYLVIYEITPAFTLKYIGNLTLNHSLFGLIAIEESMVLIHKRSLQVYNLGLFEFTTSLNLEHDVFAFIKTAETGQTDHLLSMNSSDGSVHFLLRGLSVVAKFELETQVVNVLVDESKSIVLFGANKEIFILRKSGAANERSASTVDNKFNLLREIQLRKSHPQQIEFDLEIISEKTKK